jgi:hypothetical protein
MVTLAVTILVSFPYASTASPQLPECVVVKVNGHHCVSDPRVQFLPQKRKKPVKVNMPKKFG